MKNIKKIIIMLLVMAFAIILVACEDEEITELDTRYTDGQKMDFSFSGKEFVTNGIGEVTLNHVVDGDTMSVFTSGVTGSISIRFLGINTPESTGSIEAWGKAASTYAKGILNKAKSIVLEAEGERKDSNGTRWLAWVWYIPEDGTEYRLFNLEEVEMAYTKYVQKVDSKYHNVMKQANDKTKPTGLRVWGEQDPNFSYSTEVIETTLLNIWFNNDVYQDAQFFKVKVRLVRTVGNNMFLEDAEEESIEINNGSESITGKGSFYAFSGYAYEYYRSYEIGDVFTIECQVQWAGDYGNQLTGLRKPSKKDKELSGEPILETIDANDIEYELLSIKDLNDEYVTVPVSQLAYCCGQVVTVQNLKCINIYDKSTDTTNYYTVTFENENGVKIDAYFNNSTTITDWQVYKILTIGSYYNVTGGISFYQYANGYYQIVMGDAPRYSGGILNDKDIFRANEIVLIEK